jgi:membrane-associated phospholipid phosphatase
MIARHERALLSIAALSLVMVFAIFLAVRGWGPLPGELRFEEWRVDGGYPAAWNRPLSFVTYLADPWVGVGMVIVLAVVVADEIDWRTALLVPAAAASALLSDLLKAVLGPTSQEYGGAAGINLGPGANFPSGHAAYAVAVYGVVSWLAFGRGHRGVAGALALPVVLMGPALALLGNHYPADIVAGYALGLGWLLLVLLVGERLRLTQPEDPTRPAQP